jgi:hypothetical protein
MSSSADDLKKLQVKSKDQVDDKICPLNARNHGTTGHFLFCPSFPILQLG